MSKKFNRSITLAYKLSKESDLKNYEDSKRFIKKSLIVNLCHKFKKYSDNKEIQIKIFQAYLLLMKFQENIVTIYHNYNNLSAPEYLEILKSNLYQLLDNLDYVQNAINTHNKLEIADYRRDYEDFFDYVHSLINSLNTTSVRFLKELYTILINDGLDLIQEQIDSFKFLFPLLVFSFSPFCNETEKEFSRNLYSYLRKIVGDSNLNYIQIQSKALNKRKAIDKRNSYDGTTRFLFIFTRRNYDIYLARLDFPHKNENQIHINLHELKNGKYLMEACYPLSEKDINKLSLSDEEIQTLFLKTKDGYFFRSKKTQIIGSVSKPQSIKDQLRKLLRQQSHIEIFENTQEKSFLKFISYYCKSITELHLGHLDTNSFDKEDDKNIKKLNDLFDKYSENERDYIYYKLLHGHSVEDLKKQAILLQQDFIEEIAKTLENHGFILTRP